MSKSVHVRQLGLLAVSVLVTGFITLWAAAEPPIGTPGGNSSTAAGWGQNNRGELGDGSKTAVEKLPLLSLGGSQLDGRQVSAVAAGDGTSCAIAAGGLYCWGSNTAGQLGMPGGLSSANPVKILGPLTDKFVTDVSVGANRICAVADAAAYCWGMGGPGLGSDLLGAVYVPQPVDTSGALSGKSVTAISTGTAHTCAIADAAVFCWGANEEGQLGVPKGPPIELPVAVPTDGDLKGKAINSVSVGLHHTCVAADGTGYCWGDNGVNQLGGYEGGWGNNHLPIPVKTSGALAGKFVYSVSVGGSLSCAIAGVPPQRGSYCWGHNLATGIADQVKKIDLPGSVSSLSANVNGACATVTGKTHCWGKNTYGRLGDGTFNISATPVLVKQTGVLKDRRQLSVAAGVEHSLAVAAKVDNFDDVPANHPFSDDISWVRGMGISTGYDDGSYKPGTAIDRAAMAAFLYRFAHPGAPKPVCSGQTRLFDDVPKTAQFCGHIEWLVEAKVIDVPADKLFDQGAPTARHIMATWIFRTFHPGVPNRTCGTGERLFDDVKKSNSACGNIEWLARAGVTAGYVDGLFKPANSVNRDSMAAFFHRAAALNLS